MYNLRDEKGTMKAKVPHDVVSIIIQQQIVTFFNDRRNKVCLRVTQDTKMFLQGWTQFIGDASVSVGR